MPYAAPCSIAAIAFSSRAILSTQSEFIRSLAYSSASFSASYSGTQSSAAALGVGARRSATKSAMVKSVSCPTALTTGVLHAYMARATTSSLKAHSSSMLPPPRPTIITSALPLPSSRRIASAISLPAPVPCTAAGATRMFIIGNLLRVMFIMSCKAAPVLDVTTPMHLGSLGIGFLCAASNSPWASRRVLSIRKRR